MWDRITVLRGWIAASELNRFYIMLQAMGGSIMLEAEWVSTHLLTVDQANS